jgi:hypothetical protein
VQLSLALVPAPRLKRRDEDFMRWQRLCREADAIEEVIAERWPEAADDGPVVFSADGRSYVEWVRLNDVAWDLHGRAVEAFAPLVPRVRHWWG